MSEDEIPCKNCITLPICKQRAKDYYGDVEIVLKCDIAAKLCEVNGDGLKLVSGLKIRKLMRYLRNGETGYRCSM